MPSLVTFVEGPGDEAAVPVLLTRILGSYQSYDWYASRAIRVGSIGTFRKRIDDFISYVRRDPECGGALVLLDLDDGCPKDEAIALAQKISSHGLPFPVAVVFAHREFEAWFLASISSISYHFGFFRDGLSYAGEPEELRAAKAWLSNQMPAGKIYKETLHQKQFSQVLELRQAFAQSRSFRRLYKAVGEVLAASGTSRRGIVTPT